jgi:hypothetical protein
MALNAVEVVAELLSRSSVVHALLHLDPLSRQGS